MISPPRFALSNYVVIKMCYNLSKQCPIINLIICKNVRKESEIFASSTAVNFLLCFTLKRHPSSFQANTDHEIVWQLDRCHFLSGAAKQRDVI